MPAPDDELPRGIARFWSTDGEVTGTGFLIAENTLCTCAHVVASALGVPDTDLSPPSGPVTVDFPLLPEPSARVPTTVTHWRPVASDGGGDIALLSVDPVPGTAAVRLAGGTSVWDHPFRVLGFPLRTDNHGVWVDGRLRAPVGKGWTSMEPQGRAIGRGFSGGPVWDTEQGGVVGMTVAADTGAGASTAYLIPAAHLLGLDPALCPSPFRGLEAFREQDAAVFFARQADSARIAEALRDHPFVPVAGASGVGKSSLVRAGVLPLLRAAGYSVTDFAGQPDTDPVRTLGEALGAEFPSVRDLARALGHDRETATLLGAGVLRESGPAGHVILLDQFEETVGARPADARALLDVLLPMARAAHPGGRRLRVLATLRSASLEELVTGGRAEALSGTVQMVAPMTPAQLDEVVRRPIEAIPGVDFEPGLPEALVAEAGGEPGALPLVEFALAELWDRREHGRLTHAAYREIGGVEGALSRYADHQLTQVCKSPGGPDEATARRLFERLARPVRGKEYARVARSFDQLPAELRAAAQALAGTRLLVISRDSSGRETVALAHEALVRQWPTLRGWLDESRDFLAWHEKLRGRVREWEESDRHEDLLLRGRELGVARARVGELSDLESGFIRLSRQYQRRSVRRRRTGVALVTVLAVVAATLTYFITQAGRDAQRRERVAAANELAERSMERFDEDPVEGAALAVLAHRTAPTEETHRALLNAYPGMSMARSVREGFLDGRVKALAASADGSRVAVLEEGDRGGLRGWAVTGLSAGRPRKHRLPGVPEGVDSVAVSDDGARIAAAGPDGRGRVWRSRDGGIVDEWKERPGPAGASSVALDFSGDGRVLLHVAAVTEEEYEGAGTCLEGTKQDRVRIHLRDTGRGRTTGPPPGVPGADKCLMDAALVAGRDEGESLIVVREEAPTGDAREPETVRAHALSSGSRRWTDGPFDMAVLGAGGRTLGAAGVREFDGGYRNPATGDRILAAGRYRSQSVSDATGRFVGGDVTRDAVWHDTATGADYMTSRPGAYVGIREACPDNARDVITARGSGGPVLHVLCERDLVSFRLAPVHDLPRHDWKESAAFAPQGTLAVVGEAHASALSEARLVIAVGTGKHRRQLRTKRAGFSADSDSVVFSRSGRFLVAFGDTGWALFERGSTGLRLVRRAIDVKADPAVRDVRSLSGDDFLVLGKGGVQRLDSRGDLASAHAPGCDDPESSPCLAIEVSPRDGTAWVLRQDGTVTFWDPEEAEGRGTTWRLGPLRDEHHRLGLRFRDDGERVAVMLRDGLAVLDPDTGEELRRLPVGDQPVVRAYGADGHMVLTSVHNSGSGAGLWSEEGEQAIGLLDGLWEESAWRIDEDGLHYGTDWGIWRIPLNPDALVKALCVPLADYALPNGEAPCPANPH
ncbi:Trypsin-like peptidase domain-containing protein [Streptomyces sp. DI166]|uniref:nSTAND1 domain-containing NTPase n=1 Tax=Streptomyces sp. DI166 TaxID=1839783 RepID=UPI0007F338D7|nr:trypsin-like peptidase domain-containing protein [Streptomyces sp. DI166]SBT92939.1 Trypsin-like peptidase domain-containing protein [Streptomyces sp. DI166]